MTQICFEKSLRSSLLIPHEKIPKIVWAGFLETGPFFDNYRTSYASEFCICVV
jgi:hypothetical protein